MVQAVVENTGVEMLLIHVCAVFLQQKWTSSSEIFIFLFLKFVTYFWPSVGSVCMCVRSRCSLCKASWWSMQTLRPQNRYLYKTYCVDWHSPAAESISYVMEMSMQCFTYLRPPPQWCVIQESFPVTRDCFQEAVLVNQNSEGGEFLLIGFWNWDFCSSVE